MLENLQFSSFTSNKECDCNIIHDRKMSLKHIKIVRSQYGDLNLDQAKELALSYGCIECYKHICEEEADFLRWPSATYRKNIEIIHKF